MYNGKQFTPMQKRCDNIQNLIKLSENDTFKAAYKIILDMARDMIEDEKALINAFYVQGFVVNTESSANPETILRIAKEYSKDYYSNTFRTDDFLDCGEAILPQNIL